MLKVSRSLKGIIGVILKLLGLSFQSLVVGSSIIRIKVLCGTKAPNASEALAQVVRYRVHDFCKEQARQQSLQQFIQTDQNTRTTARCSGVNVWSCCCNFAPTLTDAVVFALCHRRILRPLKCHSVWKVVTMVVPVYVAHIRGAAP